MPEPVTRDVVAERLMDYSHDSYKYTGSIMQGVALGVATLAILSLSANFPQNWHRWILLGTSVIALLVSYMTWGRGVLLTNSRSNVLDAVFPLGMGICEFLLFGVLTDDKRPNLWLSWFLI